MRSVPTISTSCVSTRGYKTRIRAQSADANGSLHLPQSQVLQLLEAARSFGRGTKSRSQPVAAPRSTTCFKVSTLPFACWNGTCLRRHILVGWGHGAARTRWRALGRPQGAFRCPNRHRHRRLHLPLPCSSHWQVLPTPSCRHWLESHSPDCCIDPTLPPATSAPRPPERRLLRVAIHIPAALY